MRINGPSLLERAKALHGWYHGLRLAYLKQAPAITPPTKPVAEAYELKDEFTPAQLAFIRRMDHTTRWYAWLLIGGVGFTKADLVRTMAPEDVAA